MTNVNPARIVGAAQIDRRIDALSTARGAMREVVNEFSRAASLGWLEIEEVLLSNRQLLYETLELFDLLLDRPEGDQLQVLHDLETYFLAAERLLFTMLSTAELSTGEVPDDPT